jgi:D-alanyl-D-alanine endopeptidase (penicillin-binding protein 7)
MHGLEQTRFVEPTGLSIMNISTAEELIKIVMMAKDYPEIVESSKMPSIKIQTTKNKFLTYNNTNPLVQQYEFIVSKTGFITASGGCIAMMLTNGISQRIVILLGSQNTKTRIPEALSLFKLHS